LSKREGCVYFNLTNSQVEKSVSFSDFDDGLWPDTAHAGAETAVEFEDDELVEECGAFDLGDVFIGDDLLGIGRIDPVPVAELR
jgi:hypothetical protein